jgi:hypothetical protein
MIQSFLIYIKKIILWIKPINTYRRKGDPFLNKKKYSVINGSIVVSPEELVKSEKVQEQLKLIRKRFK